MFQRNQKDIHFKSDSYRSDSALMLMKDVIEKENPDLVILTGDVVTSVNAGMYTSMLECKDVMGMFVGHDHDNNYIGCLRGICLAYGNVTGRECYGKIGRGARVIELYEGERKFDTWILKLYNCDRDKDTWEPTNDYQKKFFVTYPDSFRDNTENDNN